MENLSVTTFILNTFKCWNLLIFWHIHVCLNKLERVAQRRFVLIIGWLLAVSVSVSMVRSMSLSKSFDVSQCLSFPDEIANQQNLLLYNYKYHYITDGILTIHRYWQCLLDMKARGIVLLYVFWHTCSMELRQVA